MDAFEYFKWNTLIDAFEDGWVLVAEPLMELRGNEAGRGRSEADRRALAERVMRELYDAGFIYFFREHEALREAATRDTSVDSRQRLTSLEVEALLLANWWRGACPSLHLLSGYRGRGSLLRDPPEAFRAFWNPDA